MNRWRSKTATPIIMYRQQSNSCSHVYTYTRGTLTLWGLPVAVHHFIIVVPAHTGHWVHTTCRGWGFGLLPIGAGIDNIGWRHRCCPLNKGTAMLFYNFGLLHFILPKARLQQSSPFSYWWWFLWQGWGRTSTASLGTVSTWWHSCFYPTHRFVLTHHPTIILVASENSSFRK